jgi:hypothetical protein
MGSLGWLNQVYQFQITILYLMYVSSFFAYSNNSVNGIKLSHVCQVPNYSFMANVFIWPKVIPLRRVYCTIIVVTAFTSWTNDSPYCTYELSKAAVSFFLVEKLSKKKKKWISHKFSSVQTFLGKLCLGKINWDNIVSSFYNKLFGKRKYWNICSKFLLKTNKQAVTVL